jgi:UDP-N-acetylglucosamine 1-carboxyvinyltransferase
MGCNIKWISKRSVKIEGVSEVNEITYPVMFDRIEAGTYLVAAAGHRRKFKDKEYSS